MEIDITIDLGDIADKVVEDLDMDLIASAVMEQFGRGDSGFGELVAECSGISEIEERLDELEVAVANELYITEEGLVESLVKALTSLRDSNKERAEANRELRKEIRALKEGKGDE